MIRRPPRWPRPEGWTATQTLIARDRESLRSVSDRDSLGNIARRWVDADDRLRRLARRPDGGVVSSDAVGALADVGGRRHRVRVRVDPHDGAVERVRDPNRARAEGDPGGPVAHGHGRHDFAAHRIDAHDTAARLVRDPTAPSPTATPRPTAPVRILLTTRPLTGSILFRLRSSALVTHSTPRAKTMAFGVTPTGIVCTTRFVPGSIRITVPSSGLVTQTASAPTAIPLGSPPTAMR